jgi:hypothetical protein
MAPPRIAMTSSDEAWPLLEEAAEESEEFVVGMVAMVFFGWYGICPCVVKSA